MTGKYRWTQKIPDAPEWFDFDRSEKTMENPNKTPVPDDWQPFDDDDPQFHIVKCPHCGSDDSRIISTVFSADGEAWSMNCNGCGKRFETLKKFG